MAEDRRVRRSRGALKAALRSLLAERPYASITIADICERADVGRSTFYAHYDDKKQLLDDLLGGLRAFLVAAPPPDAADAGGLQIGRALFAHIAHERVLLRALLSHGDDEVTGSIRVLLDDVVRRDLEPRVAASGRTRVPVDLVVAHVVASLVAVLTWWSAEDARESPDEVARYFRTLTEVAVAAALAPGGTAPPLGPGGRRQSRAR